MNEFNQFIEFEEKVREAVSTTPNARPEFVNQLRKNLLQKEVKPRPFLIFKPAWIFVTVLLVLVMIVSSPRVVQAIKELFGYIPGIGLVENETGMRVLPEPVSLTRDGITLTIDHVFVYEDHVELTYDVQGIDPYDDGTQAEDAASNPAAFCGGVNIGEMANHDGDALLRLPDGSLLERDRTGLYPQNAFAMTPVFKASIPKDVMKMTLVLKCIPWTRIGAVPENWEIPFNLVQVPQGELVGLPVIEVEQNDVESTLTPPGAVGETDNEKEFSFESTENPSPTETLHSLPATDIPVPPSPQIEMVLEKVAQTESTTVFYIRMGMEDPDPSLVSIMPENVYVIDELGQKIQLIPSGPWQPFLHRTGSLFEYVSSAKPADGPLTLVMENAVMYYAPLYVDPPQAVPAEMTFTFDVGVNPQRGQNWALDSRFEVSGYPIRVVSARAVVWEDVAEAGYIDGSQGYDYGYQFAIQGNPQVKMSVDLDLLTDKCGLWVKTPPAPESSDSVYTSLCREAYPTGEVAVIVRELSVLIEDRWQITWNPTGH